MVTRPAVSPYSSTTMAMWIFFERISCIRMEAFRVSGTK